MCGKCLFFLFWPESLFPLFTYLILQGGNKYQTALHALMWSTERQLVIISLSCSNKKKAFERFHGFCLFFHLLTTQHFEFFFFSFSFFIIFHFKLIISDFLACQGFGASEVMKF